MLKIIFGIFIFAFFLSCGGGPERITYIGGTQYFPLRDGRTLSYRQTENGKSSDYTMRLRYVGGRARKLYSAKIEGVRYGGLEFRSYNNIIEASMQVSPTSLYSRESVGEFRQIWIDENVAVDSGWFDEDTGTETIFTGYEGVTVPAGRFAECYKTEVSALPELADSLKARFDRKEINEDQYQLELAESEKIIERWFAKDIGLIKEKIGPDLVRELLSVDSVGGGILDTLSPETIPIIP